MSLYDQNLGMMEDMMKPCHMLDRKTVNRTDGQFGTMEIFEPGATFNALIEKTASPEVVVAEQQGVREQYTVIVPKGVTVKSGEVFRRDADGLTLMATSSTVDREAPDVSTVQIAVLTAKRWDLP